jgi:hypothetical protein
MPPDGTSVGKKNATLTVAGTVDDPGVTTVTLAGKAVAVQDGRFSGRVTLANGLNTVTATAVDAAGNKGSDSVNITLDNKPPYIRFKILNFEKRTFEGVVEPGATLTVNGKPVNVDEKGYFKFVLASAEYTELKFVVRDAAGNITERVY